MAVWKFVVTPFFNSKAYIVVWLNYGYLGLHSRAVRLQQNSHPVRYYMSVPVPVARYPLSQDMECATQVFMHVPLINEQTYLCFT